MHAYIASARRAFLLTTVALVAACSSNDSTAPVHTPDQDPPADTIPTPSPAIASIEITGDEEVVVTYAGHLYAAARNVASLGKRGSRGGDCPHRCLAIVRVARQGRRVS